MKLRYGKISETDPENGVAKVKWDDLQIVSPWLQVMQRNTLDNQEESWPDENEHVACLMEENMATGLILGAIWDKKNKPPVGTQNIWVKKFKDGFAFKYDRENHKLELSGNSDVEVTADVKKLTVKVSDGATVDGDFKVTGDVTVDGKLDVQGDISSNSNISAMGDIDAQGSMSANGNVTAGSNVVANGDVQAGGGTISLLLHKHVAPPAGGNTGPSIP